MSRLTFLKDNLSPADSYSVRLNEIYEKIHEVKRQISYFDVYNVVDVVVDKDTFSAKVAALPLNSSLVVNCDESFYNNDKLYSRGDIIFKINTGENVHIKSQTGGVYYPSRLTQDGPNFTIEYNYSASEPANGENKIYSFKATPVEEESSEESSTNIIYKDEGFGVICTISENEITLSVGDRGTGTATIGNDNFFKGVLEKENSTIGNFNGVVNYENRENDSNPQIISITGIVVIGQTTKAVKEINYGINASTESKKIYGSWIETNGEPITFDKISTIDEKDVQPVIQFY